MRPGGGPRDARKIDDFPTQGTSIRKIASLMVGRTVEAEAQAEAASAVRVEHAAGKEEPPVLEVEGLWVDMPGETVRSVNLAVRRGEILGIGGLAGQGKLGIPNGIMGLAPAGGTVRVNGRPLPLNAPRRVLDRGMAFVSEDRRGVGLLLDEGIDWNIAFTAMQVQDKFIRPVLRAVQVALGFGHGAGLRPWPGRPLLESPPDRAPARCPAYLISSSRSA